MRYIARPTLVDAFKIKRIDMDVLNNELSLRLEDGSDVVATKEMTARMVPEIGDYWVIQPDGYVYLNPKDVFERKYTIFGTALK
jgi:hypothetical protein